MLYDYNCINILIAYPHFLYVYIISYLLITPQYVWSTGESMEDTKCIIKFVQSSKDSQLDKKHYQGVRPIAIVI